MLISAFKGLKSISCCSVSAVVTAYQMLPAYRTLARPPADQFVSPMSLLRANEFGNIRTFPALSVASVSDYPKIVTRNMY